jgi:hypothetical protein
MLGDVPRAYLEKEISDRLGDDKTAEGTPKEIRPWARWQQVQEARLEVVPRLQDDKWGAVDWQFAHQL